MFCLHAKFKTRDSQRNIIKNIKFIFRLSVARSVQSYS